MEWSYQNIYWGKITIYILFSPIASGDTHLLQRNRHHLRACFCLFLAGKNPSSLPLCVQPCQCVNQSRQGQPKLSMCESCRDLIYQLLQPALHHVHIVHARKALGKWTAQLALRQQFKSLSILHRHILFYAILNLWKQKNWLCELNI